MVGILEIKAGYEGAKAALDIAKGINSLKTETAINGAIIEIQRHVVDAQRGLSASLQRIDELEKEIVGLKSWAAEKERYQLREFPAGSFAYALQVEKAEGEPAHNLCPNCYQEGHKAILQTVARHSNGHIVSCLRCKAEIRLAEFEYRTDEYGGVVPY